MKIKKLFAGAAAALVAQSAFAFDVNSAYVDYGSASNIKMVRIGATQNFKPEWTWFDSNGTHVAGYWDASIGYWRANEWATVPGNKKSLYDVGFAPVFRFEKTNKKGFYVEGGIGIHILSKLYDNAYDKLSTAFQFGDHIAAGYVFDSNWDVSIRGQHFSNGGLKEPNSGVNVLLLRAAYRF